MRWSSVHFLGVPLLFLVIDSDNGKLIVNNAAS